MSRDVLQSFVHASARGDFEAIRALMAPEVKFRYVTPPAVAKAQGWAETEPALRALFPPDEKVAEVTLLQVEPMGDRWKLRYRMRGHQAQFGEFEYEQYAYARTADGRITELRILCSGLYKPGTVPAA